MYDLDALEYGNEEIFDAVQCTEPDLNHMYPDELAMEEYEMAYNDASFEGGFEGTEEI